MYQVIQAEKIIHFESCDFAQALDMVWALTKKGITKLDIVWVNENSVTPLTVHDVNQPLS